ncbi:hypothetical protein DCM78_25115 [Bradyrhizobium sp. WBOS04]|nr:hypothetical protein DCM78_25115 [Bradyrhizobium sp. WBOS04]UUO58667.1 hypothetical protein DCM80_05395 [Bradyrhizobium sp. WBOS08]
MKDIDDEQETLVELRTASNLNSSAPFCFGREGLLYLQVYFLMMRSRRSAGDRPRRSNSASRSSDSLLSTMPSTAEIFAHALRPRTKPAAFLVGLGFLVFIVVRVRRSACAVTAMKGIQ